MNAVYVITWRYHDGSGSGAVSAHTTRASAERLLSILEGQDTGRVYRIAMYDTATQVEAQGAAQGGQGEALCARLLALFDRHGQNLLNNANAQACATRDEFRALLASMQAEPPADPSAALQLLRKIRQDDFLSDSSRARIDAVLAAAPAAQQPTPPVAQQVEAPVRSGFTDDMLNSGLVDAIARTESQALADQLPPFGISECVDGVMVFGYTVEQMLAFRRATPAQVGAKEPTCATCGGTQVDPGGLPACRTCTAPTGAEGVSACKGMKCGTTTGRDHSLECEAEHAAAIAGGRFTQDAAVTDDMLNRAYREHMAKRALFEPLAFARAVLSLQHGADRGQGEGS